MSDSGAPPPAQDTSPQVVVKKRRISVVWIIPIVAALVAGSLWIKALAEKGPTITIEFRTAEGIEAGKTKVKYKDIDVGDVKAIRLKQDLSGVVVTAELGPTAEEYMNDATRFWVVRPRIGAGGISGLGTLVSGAYVAIEPQRTGQRTDSFVGLEEPPVAPVDAPGLKFELHAEQLGSAGVSTPIYFRQIEVGQIERYHLLDDGASIQIDAYIKPEYAPLVRTNSRFWNASGVEMKLDANGIDVSVESIEALLTGGITFETPEGPATPAAENGASFVLFPKKPGLLETPEETHEHILYFSESTRGLSEGAPVEFRGTWLGNVTEVTLEFDADAREFRTAVVVETHSDRVRVIGSEESADELTDPTHRHQTIEMLIQLGMRARLQTGSLLTGARFIDMDMFPETPVNRIGGSTPYHEIPTIPSTGEALEQTLAELPTIVADVKRVTSRMAELADAPETRELLTKVDAIVDEVQDTVATVDQQVGPTLDDLRDAIAKAEALLTTTEQAVADAHADAPEIKYRLDTALEELAGSLRAFRGLANYLERHPEALLKGKPGTN